MVGNTGRRLSKVEKNYSSSSRETTSKVKLNGRDAGKAVSVTEMQEHKTTAN